MPGLEAVYNHHNYLGEKRRALALWAEHVLSIAEGRKAALVALRPAVAMIISTADADRPASRQAGFLPRFRVTHGAQERQQEARYAAVKSSWAISSH
jgi:predicted LPLAT superfamily acyltransferase